MSNLPDPQRTDLTRHLDLGCGSRPRNPYNRDLLFGVDIAPGTDSGNATFVRANVALEPIPFDTNTFNSVSAYDFLEHVPRVLITQDGLAMRFAFVELMNEVWRVLKPQGLFYASTPCYPHPAVFQDPTHVNTLTLAMHEYFTRPEFVARMYGFTGDFEVIRVQRVEPKHVYEPKQISLREKLRRWNRYRKGLGSHVIWEFRAIKTEATHPTQLR